MTVAYIIHSAFNTEYILQSKYWYPRLSPFTVVPFFSPLPLLSSFSMPFSPLLFHSQKIFLISPFCCKITSTWQAEGTSYSHMVFRTPSLVVANVVLKVLWSRIEVKANFPVPSMKRCLLTIKIELYFAFWGSRILLVYTRWIMRISISQNHWGCWGEVWSFPIGFPIFLLPFRDLSTPRIT